MGSKGSNGGASAHQPQPGTDADRLGFRVTTTAAVCSASGAKGAGDGPGLEGGGRGGVGPLREVSREEERETGEAQGPPVVRPGPQSGEGAGPGAGDGGGQVEDDARRGAPGPDLECPKERGRKPRVRMLSELLQRKGWC